MTEQLETQPQQARPTEDQTPLLIVAVALLAIAGYLVATRYASAAVDWHLGDLRADPGDAKALDALRRLGDSAVPRLEAELASDSVNGRVVAVLALSVIPGRSAETALVRATRNEDALTASNAVSACALRRDPETASAVAEALRDERRGVRLAGRKAAERRSGGVPWWAFGQQRKEAGNGERGTGSGE